MTDELDTKLQAAVKPIRDKGGEHCSLADAIVDAIKALESVVAIKFEDFEQRSSRGVAEAIQEQALKSLPPNSTLPIAPTKAEEMLTKAGYELVSATTSQPNLVPGVAPAKS